MPKTMEIFWISRWSHFEEKIIFFKKITDYQQFSPVNDMLSTPIGKGYIILINDKSLWGKYVLRNADFRFSAQIRSHFLLHQKANHHILFKGHPYFSPVLHWHTNGDTPWDIPSFCWHSIYQPPGTLLGTSLIFYHALIVTQLVTPTGISQQFRPHRFATNSDTFCYTQFVPRRIYKANNRDTSCDTALISWTKSSGLRYFSNRSCLL